MDLNQFRKLKLTDRIKKVAPQIRIRSEEGPTIQDIYNLLEEINPIIFQEGRRWRNEDQTSPKFQKRNWNRNRTIGLDGWIFTNLCRTIYKILCTKVNIKNNIRLIQEITRLSIGQTQDNNGNDIDPSEIIHQIIEPENTTLISTDPKLRSDAVGMEEISQARQVTERNTRDTETRRLRDQQRIIDSRPFPKVIMKKKPLIGSYEDYVGKINQPIKHNQIEYFQERMNSLGLNPNRAQRRQPLQPTHNTQPPSFFQDNTYENLPQKTPF